MIFKSPLLIGLAGATLLAGCVQDPYAYSDPNARTKAGVVTGAVVGAGLGALSGSRDDRLQNTVLGGVVGAVAGGAIGNTLDRQAAELRQQLGGSASVVNTGNSINVTMGQDILFATDSTVVLPGSQGNLSAIANNLTRYPNSRIEVIGHTDSDGEAAYNQDLSERRARSVAGALMSYGVAPARIAAFGRGEDQPIASNLTPQGKQANRRVEIIIRPN